MPSSLFPGGSHTFCDFSNLSADFNNAISYTAQYIRYGIKFIHSFIKLYLFYIVCLPNKLVFSSKRKAFKKYYFVDGGSTSWPELSAKSRCFLQQQQKTQKTYFFSECPKKWDDPNGPDVSGHVLKTRCLYSVADPVSFLPDPDSRIRSLKIGSGYAFLILSKQNCYAIFLPDLNI